MAKSILLATILGCLLWNLARADILFDNGNHVQTGGESDSYDDFHNADDFILPSSAAVTQITWKGFHLTNFPVDDNFEIFIYADDGSDGPTSPVTNSAIYSAVPTITDNHPTGEVPFPNEPVYQYAGNIPAFNAVGGTRYWLEIFDANIFDNDWLWSADTQAGNGYVSLNETDWDLNDNMTAFSFQLFGNPVPEPSTIALLTLGALCLLARRRQ